MNSKSDKNMMVNRYHNTKSSILIVNKVHFVNWAGCGVVRGSGILCHKKSPLVLHEQHYKCQQRLVNQPDPGWWRNAAKLQECAENCQMARFQCSNNWTIRNSAFSLIGFPSRWNSVFQLPHIKSAHTALRRAARLHQQHSFSLQFLYLGLPATRH